ncbi:hypothetical protein UNDKW_2562 [Undibacterium sp. KW1]|nr:hypothetical protein UNDKW_2562 [Undibacterium sp. KW1]
MPFDVRHLMRHQHFQQINWHARKHCAGQEYHGTDYTDSDRALEIINYPEYHLAADEKFFAHLINAPLP